MPIEKHILSGTIIMRKPHLIYNSAYCGRENEGDLPTGTGHGGSHGESMRDAYTYAGRLDVQLQVPTHTHSTQDPVNARTETPANWYRDSSSISSPVDVVQSYSQHVDLTDPNQAQCTKSRREELDTYLPPLDICFTDHDLLPSQSWQTQYPLPDPLCAYRTEKTMGQVIPRVIPTSNPYHWEDAAEVRDKQIRTHEILRQNAGTLKRNTAIRRSRRKTTASSLNHTTDRLSLTYASSVVGNLYDRILPAIIRQRSLSFESAKRFPALSVTSEQDEEETVTKSFSSTRVDSGIAPDVGETVPQSGDNEEQEEPRIARTFSQILGDEPFVPTALLK
jgi:hypothetical protein